MVRDPFFDEVIGCELADERDGAPVGVVHEIDAWFTDASHGNDVSASYSETESGRELVGAAALPAQCQLIHPSGHGRHARGGVRGRGRTRRREEGHGSRVRYLAVVGIAVASLLALAIVILRARPPAPDAAARPAIAGNSAASRPTRVAQQRRERVYARRASRTLAHRRTVARERRAATRRAGRRSAVRRQRAARVHTPSNAPTLTVTNPQTERPHPRLSPVQPEKRKPPAATGEFEP